MQAIYVDQPPKQRFGQTDTVDLRCSYYLALPSSQSRDLTELLQVKHATPLLKLLLQNERDEDAKILLENCCALRGDYIGVPLVASPITAMTLGFFAYKPEHALSGEESQPLQLLQFSCRQLLDRMPPFSNPLCPFWLMKPCGLVRLINDCQVALTVEHFKMQVTLMAETKPQLELLQRHDKMRLQFHKRALEDRVEQLQFDLEEKKGELTQVIKKIRAETKASEEPDPEVQNA